MTITGNISHDVECRMDSKDRFRVRVWLQGFNKTFEMGGKVANYIYENFRLGDRVTIFINRKDIIYRAKLERQ